MIIPMTTAGRRQRRYDHRLQDLVQRSGNVTIATGLGGPALHGPWVASQSADGRGEPGRHESEGTEAPTRSSGAPATREEAHRTASAHPRRASNLGITLTHTRLPDG